MHQLKWEWYLCTRRLSHYAPVNPAWKSLTAYLSHSGVNDYITMLRFRPLCGLTQYARQPSNYAHEAVMKGSPSNSHSLGHLHFKEIKIYNVNRYFIAEKVKKDLSHTKKWSTHTIWQRCLLYGNAAIIYIEKG